MPDAKAQPDAAPAGDLGTLASAMQAVVSNIILPKNANDYAYDYEGNGTKKNQLGAIMGIIGTLGLGSFDLQAKLDAMLRGGALLLLFDVSAPSISSATAARLQAYMGKDKDSDLSDNFSGTEELQIDPSSPQNLVLNGKITASRLQVGPGAMIIPLPTATPTMVTINKTNLEAMLSSTPLTAMSDGKIYGTVPWTEVDAKLIPAVAGELNTTYTDSGTPQNIKDILKNIFDGDKDGTITAAEVRGNLLLKMVLTADVDTDGDKKADSMSVGIGFSGVTCKITK